MRISYLGPAGTYNEEALLGHAEGLEFERFPCATIYDAIRAVESGDAELGLVPFENSIEGTVRTTLDALAFDTEDVSIIGEYDLGIRHNLIAGSSRPIEEIELVLSHPQANAQCARFIRENLPTAEVRSIASTSDAVRQVAADPAKPWAALGSATAAAAYGAEILRSGIEDEPDNVTRFVWIKRGPAGDRPGLDEVPWRTTVVFSELGDDHPGALVEALLEFSDRGVNLTRIESRPLRRGLGRYLFFIDLEGRADEGAPAEALAGLRGKAETVRLLGSYPVGGPPPLPVG